MAAWLICVESFSILGGGGGGKPAMPTSILVGGCMHAHADTSKQLYIYIRTWKSKLALWYRIPGIRCVAWQNRSQTRKICQIYFPSEGLFRETNKSQNIIPISPTPKFTFGIIQIKVKSLSTSFQWLVQYKINLSVWLRPDLEVRGVCKVKMFASM